jgi:hypothetical protein
MGYQWVIAAYDPRSDRGKSVQAHADSGLGYVVQNPDRMKGDRIIAAFKFPANQPIPRHLTLANPMQVERLEKRMSRG